MTVNLLTSFIYSTDAAVQLGRTPHIPTVYTYCFVPTQDTHTHTPSSFNCVWPRALRKLHNVVCTSRLCWCKCHRVTQVLDSAMANQGPLMLLQMLLQLPQKLQLPTAASRHITQHPVPQGFLARAVPSLPPSSASPRYVVCIPDLSALGRSQLTGNSPVFLDKCQICILGMHALISNSFLLQPSLPSSQEMPN